MSFPMTILDVEYPSHYPSVPVLILAVAPVRLVSFEKVDATGVVMAVTLVTLFAEFDQAHYLLKVVKGTKPLLGFVIWD